MVIVAPAMAPKIVNISRYIPTLMLAIPALTKEAAEPLDAAIMATIPAAIASLTGIPSKTSIGTRMLAPPRPISAPRKPTTIDIKVRENMFSIFVPVKQLSRNLLTDTYA